MSNFGPHTWPAGTRIQLVRVPWDSQYRDLVSWSDADKVAWFDGQANSGQSVVFNKVQYLPLGRPIKLPMNIDDALQYNYIRVSNFDEYHSTKDYYYFISGLEFSTPNTTLMSVQLDVWQTYQQDVEFTQCYVERGHVGIADYKSNVDSYASYGQALLNLSEGLDTGPNMPVTKQEFYALEVQNDRVAFMVTSSIDLLADPGTIDAPNVKMAVGGSVETGGDAGATYFFADIIEYKKMLGGLTNYPWILQGIVNVVGIPSAIFNAMVNTPNMLAATSATFGTQAGVNFYLAALMVPLQSIVYARDNFRDTFDLPERYQYLKKFLTYPYCAIEITNFAGQSLVIQPERIWSDNLELDQVFTVRPVDPRIIFYPRRYGAHDDSAIYPFGSDSPEFGVEIDGGEFLNAAVTTDNLPRYAVLTNDGLMYYATNARSIAYQQGNALWSQNKALRGADVSAQQASAGIAATSAQTGNNVNALNSQRALQNNLAALRAGGTALRGVASGNPVSAASGVAGAAVDYNTSVGANDAQYGIASTQADTAASISNKQAGIVRDTNLDYEQYAAKGDYQQAIAGINARVQDSEVTSPGTVGATGGDGLLAWYGLMGIMVRYKQITASAMRTIGEYWLRFGYYVQQFVTPPAGLHVMSHFTYWKMADTYIRSLKAPETACDTIRGIFEKGVTVWRNPDEIATIDLGINTPIVNNYLNIKAPGDSW